MYEEKKKGTVKQKEPGIIKIVKGQSLGWFGHVKRMEKDRLQRQVWKRKRKKKRTIKIKVKMKHQSNITN